MSQITKIYIIYAVENKIRVRKEKPNTCSMSLSKEPAVRPPLSTTIDIFSTSFFLSSAPLPHA